MLFKRILYNEAYFNSIQVWISVLTLLFILSACDRHKTLIVQTEKIEVTSPDQILPIEDSLVRPIVYTNISGLGSLPVSEIKSKFIAAMLPSILIAKHETETKRSRIQWLLKKRRWKEVDSTYYLSLKNQYKASDAGDLLNRLETLPVSIVLAQAAIESGWGQSRFFLEGNNVFGVWAYGANEPKIPALRMRKDKTIYLRKYEDVSQSVSDYFRRLARANAYKSLRHARSQTANPFELIPHLEFYSERRSAYTDQLKKIIMQNDLTRFDHYKIDAQYLMEE